MKLMKKVIAGLLAGIMILAICGFAVSAATAFTPRNGLPSVGEDAYKYYYDGNYNIFTKSGYGLPNCTCYAWGRAYEILGSRPELSTHSAYLWYDYNKEKNYYLYGKTPKLGAIACWTNSAHTTGHVAVVEQITDTAVILSESWYGKKDFSICTCNIQTMDYYNTGYIFQGFIYLITDGVSTGDVLIGTESYKCGNYEITASSLTVRSSSSTNGAKNGSVSQGTIVTVTKLDGDWGYINTGSVSGWISLKYAKKAYDYGLYKVSADTSLRLREAASTSSNILDTITKTILVSVNKINGVWGYISYNGKNGWICLDYAQYRAADSAFSDVSGTSWYADAVNFVYEREYFAGVTETSFAPNIGMTRAMFVQMLSSIGGIDTSKYKTDAFSDVSTDKWYAGAVAWAAENGIASGIGDKKFEPDTMVSREQICLMLCKFAENRKITIFGSGSDASIFADSAKINSWAYPSVNLAKKAGLISGKPGNLCDPQGMATRAEVAQIVMQFIANFT